MTLFIAALVIYALELPVWLYAVAAVVWGGKQWARFNIHNSVMADIKDIRSRIPRS